MARVDEHGGTDFAIQRKVDGLYAVHRENPGDHGFDWVDDPQLANLFDDEEETLLEAAEYGFADHDEDFNHVTMHDGYAVVPVKWVDEDEIQPDENDIAAAEMLGIPVEEL